MRVYVGDLLGDRHAVRALAFSERLPAPADEVTLGGPVEGDLVLRGTGPTVCLSGHVRAAAGLVCGACLRRFEQILHLTVGEEFGRPGLPPAGDPHGEQELNPRDFLVPVAPGDMIDVTEVIRQHLVLALPIAPRCSPDCRGLCPRCGADRNLAACGCVTDESDPRLDALRWWPAGVEGPFGSGEKRRSRGR